MVAVLAAGLSVSGCTCPGLPCDDCPDLWDVAPDAGRDAGRPDAGRDAGRDAGHDAGTDAGPRGEPGWTRFGDLPDECPIEIALHPENVPIDIGWESCGEGCRRWTGTFGLRWLSSADPGRAWVSLLNHTPLLEAVIALLDLDDGRIVSAFRETNTAVGGGPLCFMDVATSGSDVAVSAQFKEYDERGMTLLRWWSRFYRSTVDELPTARLLVDTDQYLAGIQTLRVSPTRIAAEAEGNSAYAVDDGGLIIANRALYPDYVQELHLVGDDLFWTDWADYVSIARATREGDGDGRVFYAVDGGDVRSFTTDGETFAWLQAFDQDPRTLRYAHVELWTATYDGSAFVAPHRVVDVPRFDNGAAGDGLFVLSEREPPDSTLVLAAYRLADGARARWVPPDGMLGNILYTSGTDIFVDVPGAPIRVDPRTLTFE